MAKNIIFLCFFVGLVSQLSALSASDFRVMQENSGYIGNCSTWNEFVRAMNTRVEVQGKANKNAGYKDSVRWVEEVTRMEEELVSRAYQELPKTTKIGSAYLVQLMYVGMLSSTMIYNVYIYSDPDGKRYYRLLRHVLTN
jgi:hypothetical protein